MNLNPERQHESDKTHYADPDTLATLAKLERENADLRAAISKSQDDIEQTLGRALGYPWFKDDQKNFPGATDADGVCVGDHVAESLAMEAASKISDLRAQLEEARKDAERWHFVSGSMSHNHGPIQDGWTLNMLYPGDDPESAIDAAIAQGKGEK